MNASTSYSFGATTQVSFATNAYAEGVWAEVQNPSITTEQIVCVVGLTVADESNTCGNPGPGSSQHIGITTGGQPANAPGTFSNYVEVDGDYQWGAPVWTAMSLTPGDEYQISFYQASNEEDGNKKIYNDSWQMYIIPGATQGVYICPVCTTPVNPLPADLAFTSDVMYNAGGVSTPWELETYAFIATSTSEVLEFVTDAMATTSGAFQPPFLDLAGVTTTQITPEPATWVMAVLGVGLVFAGTRLRRLPAAAYRRRVGSGD